MAEAASVRLRFFFGVIRVPARAVPGDMAVKRNCKTHAEREHQEESKR